MNKTFNPFKTVGSYIGMFVGYYFYLKDIDAFGFVLYYINFSTPNLLIANLIGGFIIGYILYVFIRAFVNMGMFRKFSSKKNNQKREIKPSKGL